MSSVTERDRVTALASQIVEHLHGVRERLAAEIRSYPTPIPRCDAQFNHLYEQLGRLARDLDAIEGAASERAAAEIFLASRPYTEDPLELKFRSRIRAALR